MPMANEDDDGNAHSLVITPQSNFSSLITLRVGCNQLTTFPPGTAPLSLPCVVVCRRVSSCVVVCRRVSSCVVVCRVC